MSPMVSTPLTTEHALLGFLFEQPMHGYEIHRRLSETEGIGLVWRLKQNQVYALLAKLEREDYVTVTLEPQQNRPDRKVYHLTETGRDSLLAWIQAPVQHGRKLRLDFLAKLYFARRHDQAAALALVKEQRAHCERWLQDERDRAAGVQKDRRFDWLVHRFRVGQLESMIDWLDVCRQELAAAQ